MTEDGIYHGFVIPHLQLTLTVLKEFLESPNPNTQFEFMTTMDG